MNKEPDEDLIDRVISGMATPDEANSLAEWFATNRGQEYLSKRIDKEIYTDKDLIQAIVDSSDIPSDEMYKSIERRISRKRFLKIAAYAAVILLPLLVMGWGMLKLNDSLDIFGDVEYVEVYVPKGEQLQVMFQDGSKAYLNSDTKLRYPKRFALANRKIFLDGEGYFIIEKNKQRPFIIEVDRAMVQVLGTAFNLQAYDDENTISVVLDNGSVNLSPVSSKQTYALAPRETMVYNKLNGTCLISSDTAAVAASSWKEDIVYLKEKPLEELLRVLNRKYNVKFYIEDSESLEYNYTILISKNTPLSKVLYDLEQIAPVSFHQQNDSIKVKIKKK